MILSGHKKYRLWLILIIAGLLIAFFLFIKNRFFERSQTAAESKICNHLLHLRRPNWNGYAKLNRGLGGLLKNWDGVSTKSQAKNDGDNSFIQTELDRQISEIKRISEIEQSLKLSEVNETIQDYAAKRRSFFDAEFQKKFLGMKAKVQFDFARKKVETAEQLHNFENSLLSEQRLDLVNLQLELAISDLKKGRQQTSSYRKKIQAKITAIKLEIARKVAAKKELLNNQLVAYQRQENEEIQQQLDNLRLKFDQQLENDLAAFKANLIHNYDEWHQNQTEEFEKAIGDRQQQKKN